jgi:hypothetical protein
MQAFLHGAHAPTFADAVSDCGVSTAKKQKAYIAAGLLYSGARSWTRTNDPLINSQVL